MAMLVNVIPAILTIRLLYVLNAIIPAKIVLLLKISVHHAILDLKELYMKIIAFAIMDFLMMEQMKLV